MELLGHDPFVAPRPLPAKNGVRPFGSVDEAYSALLTF